MYLNSDLSVGAIGFYFEHSTSISLNRFQFAQQQSQYLRASNYSSFKYSSNYKCNTDFVESSRAFEGTYYRVTTCVRAYKLLDGLYDSILLVQNHGNLESFSARMSLSALEPHQIKLLNERFIAVSL